MRTPPERQLMQLARQIARMTLYMGTDDDPSDDDAIEALNGLIRQSREMLGIDPIQYEREKQ